MRDTIKGPAHASLFVDFDFDFDFVFLCVWLAAGAIGGAEAGLL